MEAGRLFKGERMKKKKPKANQLPKTKTTFVMGYRLPDTTLIRVLSRAHVVATQEYDHRTAHLLEKFIHDYANRHKETQPKKKSYLKIALDQLYELDNRIGLEFHKTTPPLFMASTHGYILAEIAEIRALINCAVNCNEMD
jgi:hypothetical protein